jgi:large subunit ribosomal protein L9
MAKQTDRKIKVILMEQIRKDKPGTSVYFKKGYALNYLIPQGKAVHVVGNENLVESMQKELDEKHSKLQNESQNILNKLQELFAANPLIMERASGMRGILYGSISASDIAKELDAKYQIHVNKKDIVFNPIKVIGNYTSKIHLYGDIVFKLPISIIGLS